MRASLVLLVAIYGLAICFGSIATAATLGYYSPNSSGFKVAVFYYGWLNTSDILDLRVDIVVVAGTSRVMDNGDDRWIIDELLSRGVEVYAYIHDASDNPVGLGSLFRKVVNGEWNLSQYVSYVKSIIDRYVGLFTGVFLDECDPSYFTSDVSPSNEYVSMFTSALQDIVSYAHSKGLRVFINGVRAYASLGDYYLWEDFVAIYDQDSGGYVLDTQFFSTSSDNPYEWVNGIAKYNYLAEHSLLNRTIALSFSDSSSIDNAEIAYYMARVLGLRGWGFAPIDIYAGGGRINTIEVYEPGPSVSGPSLDSASASAWRMFVAGNVSVHLQQGLVSTPFSDYPRAPSIDGVFDSSVGTSGAVGGYGDAASLTMYVYKVYSPGRLVYVYANGSWPGDPGAGLLHLYIDSDGSVSTGYRVNGIGADYLVEVYTSGSAILFSYSGSGNDWSWRALSSVTVSVKSSPGYKYSIELGIPLSIVHEGATSLVAAPISQWNDVIYTDVLTISGLVPAAPTIYDFYDSSEMPVVTSVTVEPDYTIVYADAPSGMLAVYRIVLPYSDVSAVYKNNVPLTEKQELGPDEEGYTVTGLGNGYVRLVIQVLHNSPVTLRIEAPAQPIPESVWLTVTAAIVALFFVALSARR